MSDTIAVPQEAQRLAAQARRCTTPCGKGEMVWHVWGEARPGVRPLVLLHGGCGSWMHWLRNIETLVAAGRQVWAPDLPGFGDSAQSPLGSDAPAMLVPLHAGLLALLGGQPCDLVGFSFGGLTAALLLAAHPELACRLVLVGAPAMGVVKHTKYALKGWRHLPTQEAQWAIHRYNLGALMLHDQALIEGLALQIQVANVLRERASRRRLSRTDALARALAQVACPVHAIYGWHDVLYKDCIHQLEDAYAAAAPDFRGLALVADAGHWVQFERSQAFDAALLAALD